MIFITKLLWFWIVMGALVSLAFWGTRLATAAGRAKFTDAAIRDNMVRGESDPLKLRLADIFGSRLGVVLLVFAFWPIALYAMLFSNKRS
jgi:hypothetical protein